MQFIALNAKPKCQSKRKKESFIVPIADYIMEAKYSITEVCSHEVAVTVTLSAECGCETTAEFCTECGEQLTQPKTDC